MKNESSQATTLNLQHGDGKMENEEWIAYVVALCNRHIAPVVRYPETLTMLEDSNNLNQYFAHSDF